MLELINVPHAGSVPGSRSAKHLLLPHVVLRLLPAVFLAAGGFAAQAASADWSGAGANVAWATTANWTTGSPAGGAAANTDVAGFKSTFTGSRQPTYPNSAYYLGAWWASGSPKDITVTSGGTASYALIEGVDGANVNQTPGTLYGVVMDDSGTARKLTISTRTVEIRDNDQAFYIGLNNTLNCNPSASPQYTALNGRTLTLSGAGATQLRYLNNNASLTTGAIVLNSGRLDILNASAGGVSGGVSVNGGQLVLWHANCLGASGASAPLTLGPGCTINSGVGGALATATPLTISGDFTFSGYMSLGFGNYPVTVTAANPVITCNANELALAGSVTNTTIAGGNSLDLSKAGPGTLTLSAPIILRATQTATVQAGTNNLNGIISDGGNGYGLTLAGTGTLNLNANNTFTGPVTINFDGGTLNLNGANAYAGAAVNSGRLATTTASTGAGAYSVSGGATLSVKVAGAGATLNVSSLAAAAGSTLELNFSTLGNPTTPVITVAGAFEPTTAVTLNLIGLQGTVGLVPLIQYGTLGADQMAAFSFTPPPGINATLTNNTATGTILVYVENPPLVWDGTVNGDWDISGTANWKTGAYYTETGGGGPPVVFDDTATGPNTAITLNATPAPYSITVDSTNKTYSFAGGGYLIGAGSLTKKGPSTLTVATGNTISGPVTLSGGTLQLGDGTTVNGSLAGDIANNAALIFANPSEQTCSGAISGNGKLSKTGVGALTLSGANSYAGGTTFSPAGAATVTMGSATALGSGAITNDSGAGNTVTLALSDNYTLANNVHIASGTLYLQNATTAGASFTGNFTGAGVAYFGRTGTSGGKSVAVTGDWSGFSGTLGYGNGLGASSTYLTIQGAASDFSRAIVYTEGRTTSCTFLNWAGANNATVRMGALTSGTGGGMIGIAQNITGVTFEIGALNTDSSYGGVIGANSAGYREFALTKVGSGKLTLTGGCYHTGTTTVSNGVLLVDGTFANASAVTVINGSLGGHGTINGPVAIQSGATLAPQNIDVGPLRLKNQLTLAADSFTQIQINKDLGTCDAVTNITTLTYGGTLTVTNLSGTLALGDHFQLFSATTTAGNFATNSLPTLSSPDLQWVFQPTSGVLRVVSTVANDPTNISYTVTGTTLTLTWPPEYAGWLIQSNSVSVTDSNAWYDVPGSDNATTLDVPLDSQQVNVFYRMRRPW